VAIAHWDEAPARHQGAGHLGGTWHDLGTAAGSAGVGVRRIEIDAGLWSTPAHVHGSAEEIFFVLGGSGLSWQDGQAYEVRRGDCLVHRRESEPHTLKAGPEGLDVLAYGHRRWDEAAHLPRAGTSWLAESWVEAGHGATPWEREIAAGPPEVPEPSARPASIVNLEDVDEEAFREADCGVRSRPLSAAAGSELSGLVVDVVDPGMLNGYPHCHSAEEEIFIVLEGDGVCLLGDDEHPMRRGSVVARPPGTRIAHTFRGGAEGMTILVYGTREPNDICYYPRSRKVALRGIGVVGRLEPIDEDDVAW
jgi:uncharacterized cupin superfamily protein